MDKVYYLCCFSRGKPLFYAVFKVLFAQSFTFVSLVFLLVLHLLPASDINFTSIAILCLVSLENKRLAANSTYFGVRWLGKLDIQFLIQRQDGGFEPFTDNMRIGDRLRASAVQQNTIPVVVIAALAAHKGIDAPALFWSKRYCHNSGPGLCGGFLCSLPCSFFGR